MPKQHPLEPGRIPGQNPATPERLPGHTADVEPTEPAGQPGDLAGVPAFLFRSETTCAITLDSSGENLPTLPNDQSWRLAEYVTLGVQHNLLAGVNGDEVVDGVNANGYYVWRPSAV